MVSDLAHGSKKAFLGNIPKFGSFWRRFEQGTTCFWPWPTKKSKKATVHEKTSKAGTWQALQNQMMMLP
jgi:hypothetical protein